MLVDPHPSGPTAGTWLDRAGSLPIHVLLLIAAIAAGTAAQGGYHQPGRLLVASLVAAALVAALRVRPVSRRDIRPVPAACAALAAWATGRAAANGDVRAALPSVLTLACLVAVLLVVRRADAVQRELCVMAIVGVGVLVAVTGWIGVAWRVQPLALATDERLWRATSTLTYANAAAALLAMSAVLSIALLLARPDSLARTVAAFLLLVGLGATLSRGGLVALLTGLVLLGVLAGVRATTRLAAPPVLGALVAVGALAPSLPVSTRPHPLIAVSGLAVGLVVAVGMPRLPGRVRPAALLIGFAVAAGGIVFGGRAVSDQGLSILADSRANLASPTRTESAQAALRLVADQPLVGVGPGKATFTWMIPDGRLVTGRYAHNEYLQLLVELGAIGFVLLLCLLAAIAVTIRRGRADAQHAVLWSGAVAALGGLLVHSGFDFLWQLPVVPLTGALLVGLAGPATEQAHTDPAVEVE